MTFLQKEASTPKESRSGSLICELNSLLDISLGPHSFTQTIDREKRLIIITPTRVVQINFAKYCEAVLQTTMAKVWKDITISPKDFSIQIPFPSASGRPR